MENCRKWQPYLILNDKSLNCTLRECRGSLSPHSILAKELLNSSAVRGWERLFLKTLVTSPNPGRKQMAKVEAIASRLGYSLTKEGGES